MPLEYSYTPVPCGFHVTMMSPLGSYPEHSIILDNAALVLERDLCYSVVRIVTEDWGFSEVDDLSPLEIPFFTSLLLSRAGLPYPFGGVTLKAEKSEPLTVELLQECREHLLKQIGEWKAHWGSASTWGWAASIHAPPILGGHAYERSGASDVAETVREIWTKLSSAGPVMLRGLGSLLKAQMVWKHGEFTDAALMFLWIALDAAHSLTLQKLRESGVNNPTSQEASIHFNTIAGYETPWEKFFEDDYENRIRFIHPDNRFGAEVRPQLLADDYLELNDVLIPYFKYLITGRFEDPSAAGC